jgi:hypothetical protein
MTFPRARSKSASFGISACYQCNSRTNGTGGAREGFCCDQAAGFDSLQIVPSLFSPDTLDPNVVDQWRRSTQYVGTAALLLAILGFSTDDVLPEHALIIAHRRNSIAGIEDAVRKCADGIEVDVRFDWRDQDSRPLVLSHDPVTADDHDLLRLTEQAFPLLIAKVNPRHGDLAEIEQWFAGTLGGSPDFVQFSIWTADVTLARLRSVTNLAFDTMLNSDLVPLFPAAAKSLVSRSLQTSALIQTDYPERFRTSCPVPHTRPDHRNSSPLRSS